MIELISAVGCHETSSEGQLYLKNGCGQEKTAGKGKGMQGEMYLLQRRLFGDFWTEWGELKTRS